MDSYSYQARLLLVLLLLARILLVMKVVKKPVLLFKLTVDLPELPRSALTAGAGVTPGCYSPLTSVPALPNLAGREPKTEDARECLKEPQEQNSKDSVAALAQSVDSTIGRTGLRFNDSWR